MLYGNIPVPVCSWKSTDCLYILIARYAYLEETDDFDEEGISLTSSVAKMTVERKGSSVVDLTFGEDIEEDKRE